MVVGHRSATVGWHAAAGRLRNQGVDEAGSFPRQLRLALEDLGPTFVKLGQVLSGRSDITPPGVQNELSKLQDHALSIPEAKLRAELERSLGSPSTGCVRNIFEWRPPRYASIGQVHRTTLHSGLRVAVKVRRPGVLLISTTTSGLLDEVRRLVARFRSECDLDPVAIVNEFAVLLRAETNFRTEAGNLEAVRKTFAASEAIMIPRVMTDMSDESLLVMDWIEGIPLSDRERLEAAGADLRMGSLGRYCRPTQS